MAKVHFRTNVLLKSIIGKDLITDDNMAVLELVKNSFDAGSAQVKIEFANILQNDDSENNLAPTSNSSSLIIRDLGTGMSEYDLTEKWLNIAYSEKKEKREEFGRLLAGNKGVGRFSCDRLGRFLTIYSRKKGEEYNKLFIDWKLFEKEGEINFNIQDVEFDTEIIPSQEFNLKTGFEDFESGTILQINCLRELWHSAKILSLKRQLERLINPNQAFKNNLFYIQIIATEFLQQDESKPDNDKLNAVVKNTIFEKLDFRTTSVHAIVDPKGEFITTTLQDRGTEIFVLKERNIYSQLANISITTYYLNPYSKSYFTKQTGIKPVDFGSIFLFINGFRIPPYGDVGDDWLGMEIRKGQGHSRFLGTREVVGRIEINDNLDRFKIISNRSGIVHNVPFEQLTKDDRPVGLFYRVFKRLEKFVVEGIRWDSVSKDEQQQIENNLNDSSWDASKEIYLEDELTRNKRILAVINSVIGLKKEDILDLKINDSFVKQIIGRQTEKAKEELENAIVFLANKSQEIRSEEFSSLLSKLSYQSNSLAEFTQAITKSNVVDSKEVENIAALKETMDKQYKEVLLQKTELERKIKEEEEARIKAERLLQIEKDKNTYLLATQKTLSPDAQGLIHNVKLTSKRSKQNAENLYEAILEDRLKKATALKWTSEIIYNSDKALKISNLITRANFKANSDYQDVNIVAFIQQYLDLYNTIYDENDLKFEVKTSCENFWKRISILDISLVLDDLISNSQKANAKNVRVILSKSETGELSIIFSDDGKGLDAQFETDNNIIFDLGVTTTDGSGIGLNYVRNTLKKMQGEIKFIGNGVSLKGAAFEITISEKYKNV